jgi:hypothetical protein
MPQTGIPIGRQGKQQELQMADRHGRYYTASYAGLSAFAANQAGAVITLFSATPGAYTGLCLSNPAASTVNLVPQTVTGALAVATTGITLLGLVTGYAAAGITVHTTPLTVFSSKLGTVITSPIMQGLADAAATLVGVPTWTRTFQTLPTTVTVGSLFNVDLNGEIVIPPGGYVCVGATITATAAASFWGSISWEEAPI